MRNHRWNTEVTEITYTYIHVHTHIYMYMHIYTYTYEARPCSKNWPLLQSVNPALTPPSDTAGMSSPESSRSGEAVSDELQASSCWRSVCHSQSHVTLQSHCRQSLLRVKSSQESLLVLLLIWSYRPVVLNYCYCSIHANLISITEDCNHFLFLFHLFTGCSPIGFKIIYPLTWLSLGLIYIAPLRLLCFLFSPRPTLRSCAWACSHQWWWWSPTAPGKMGYGPARESTVTISCETRDWREQTRALNLLPFFFSTNIFQM